MVTWNLCWTSENGFDESTTAAAALSGLPHVAPWLVAVGCPISKASLKFVICEKVING